MSKLLLTILICFALTIGASASIADVGNTGNDLAANEGDPNAPNQSADRTGTQGPKSLKPRWTPGKPVKTIREPWHDPNRVIIKFAEGSEVRLRQQGLVSLKGRDLGQVRAVLARHHIGTNQLRRYFTRPEASLDQEKRSGEARSGRQLADLNLYVELLLTDDVDIGVLCDDLNDLDIVELAEPAPVPSPPPVDLNPPTPDYTSQQGYRGASPGGIGITNNQSTNGIDGTGMAFVDVEYSWQLDHEDIELPTSANIDTATLDDPFSDTNHGTAVLGEIVGGNNGYGVTGIAPAATAFVAPTRTIEHAFNIGRAINLAAAALSPGDVILLEQQAAVCGGACDATQVGCGPVEWNLPEFDAIAAATAIGVVVVEAAGNGSVNLDDPACLSRFDTAVRGDSGAIIVGAGSSTTREKLSFSSYGSRVNVQGWGEAIYTTGYGTLFDGDGAAGVPPSDPLQLYRHDFGGTSGASPIVTGAILAIQGTRKASGLPPLLPLQMRQLLIDTGTPQSGVLHIGPLPNVGTAISAPVISMSIQDNINHTTIGDASATHSIYLQDSSINCHDGINDCSYTYRITGQSSADSLFSTAADTSSVAGQVSFDFTTSGAPAFDITVDVAYKGVVAVDATGSLVDPAGPAVAGTLAVTSTGLGGISANMSGASIPRGAITSAHEFIAPNFVSTINNVPAGAGTLSVDVDLSCASDGGFFVNGGECISSLGMPSLLPTFDVNMPFDATNPMYGILVTLTFTPLAAPDNSPPLLAITSPANNTPVNSSNILINGTASDAGQGDSGISSVTVNTVSATSGMATGGNTANWSYNATLILGTNNLSIIATDGSPNANQTSNGLTLNYIPFVVDTDGDGLDDSFETAIGTNPNLVDSDSDGQSDSQELGFDGDGSFYNQNTDTDPTSSDSDGDGFSDGDEIAAGTDPLDPVSHPIPDGDVNGDGLVDVADLLLAIRILNGRYTPTQAEQNRWDVAPLVGGVPQPDGQNTLGDYVVLQQKVMGLINF